MNATGQVKAEINSMLRSFGRAVSRRDVQGVMNLFAPDADIVMLGSEKGERAYGPKGLKKFLEGVLSRRSTYSWRWRKQVISSSGSVAWVTAEGYVTVTTGKKKKTYPYRMTGVFERRATRWVWLHYHGSEPA